VLIRSYGHRKVKNCADRKGHDACYQSTCHGPASSFG
jgi:hypothetical protein